MNLKPLFLFATAALVTSTAIGAAPSSPHESGWYMGAGIGRATNNIHPSNYPSDTHVDTKSTGYQLHGGYQFNKYLMTEMAYVDFGTLKIDSPTAYATAKIRALTLSAIGMVPFSQDFSLLGKLGLAQLMIDANEASKSGAFRFDSSATRTTLLMGLGMRYLITPSVALRAEYDYVPKTQVFQTSAKLSNSMMSLGIDYRF